MCPNCAPDAPLKLLLPAMAPSPITQLSGTRSVKPSWGSVVLGQGGKQGNGRAGSPCKGRAWDGVFASDMLPILEGMSGGKPCGKGLCDAMAESTRLPEGPPLLGASPATPTKVLDELRGISCEWGVQCA